MTDRTARVDGMRRPHENPTEWRLRKAFLAKNLDVLGPERLECLSNCFVNHELYGAGYPSKVMSEVATFLPHTRLFRSENMVKVS
ncbi:hypothetical protein ECG_05058 [Echinococcus granulosus]|uniref:Expressed conserved protein n=1 Tax=Echinococcus granulosus TaxID=6210 RepID=A0A068X2U6_ECHGR|nr:hypothetical protein ECG_05058 [Echinococcus granulosus]CDS24226.1 expressed conserved protein [Echinococcus granulosus]